MLEIQKQFINYNKSARTVVPQYIVIHDTGDPGATAKNEHDYFSGGNRNASADYFVDSTNIIQIINTDNFYSWQCGDGRGAYGITNSNSLGIEMCIEKDGNPTDATIQNTIDLVNFLMNKYNIKADHVVRHYDASRKICPNSFSANNWSKWNEFKSKIGTAKTTGYVVTDYLPNGSNGDGSFVGVDLNYVLSYFTGVKCYVRGDNNGVWIETQILPYAKCQELQKVLGSWFYAIR